MIYILIVIGIYFLDSKLKNYMEETMQLGEKKTILNGKIILKKQYNRGMFLNLLEDNVVAVKKISGILLGFLLMVFVLLLPRKHNKLLKLGLALCLGGGISNMADRVKHGYVIDYFSFNCKALRSIVFNLADMFIFLGSFFILLSSLFFSKVKCSTDEAVE